MGVLEHSVWIAAPQQAVWRVYVDPSRIPDWQTGSPVIVDARGPGDRPGSTYGSKRSPGTARTAVLAADAPNRLVTRTDAYLGLRFDVESLLRTESGGTRLDLRTVTRWPRGLGLVGRLVEYAVLNRNEGNKELANLKDLVEREARGPGD